MSRIYEIVEYDPAWPERFMQEAGVLREVFGPDAQEIQHIGSTSVPGMRGKPQVDLLVLVPSVAVVDRHVAALQDRGYVDYGDMHQNGGRLLSREQDGTKLSNVHVYLPGHPFVEQFLRIRDYLRERPEEAERYGRLKADLKRQFPDDYRSYRRHKDEYVAKLFERAKADASLPSEHQAGIDG